MERCTNCNVELESTDKFVVNWGWCDDCWEAAIDLDHILNELPFIEYMEYCKEPPGAPSEHAKRIISLIKMRIQNRFKPKQEDG